MDMIFWPQTHISPTKSFVKVPFQGSNWLNFYKWPKIAQVLSGIIGAWFFYFTMLIKHLSVNSETLCGVRFFIQQKKIDWIIKIRNNLTKIFKPFWDTACFRWLDLEAVKTDVNSVKPTAFCSLITFGLEMITNFSQDRPLLLYNGTLIIKILRNMEPYRGPKCFL